MITRSKKARKKGKEEASRNGGETCGACTYSLVLLEMQVKGY
jgi:hypothetical protein